MIWGMDAYKSQLVDKGKDPLEPGSTLWVEAGGFAVPTKHVYVWKDVRRPGVDLLRRWNFISRKVDALAA
jgi:hypothetical protein